MWQYCRIVPIWAFEFEYEYEYITNFTLLALVSTGVQDGSPLESFLTPVRTDSGESTWWKFSIATVPENI